MPVYILSLAEPSTLPVTTTPTHPAETFGVLRCQPQSLQWHDTRSAWAARCVHPWRDITMMGRCNRLSNIHE